MLKTSYIKDFINLIYPETCAACGNVLFNQEKLICTKCLYELPKTNFHLEKDNPVNQIFWGRAEIENATAYYYFLKASIFQKLIHKLKYKGLKEIGYELGKLLGAELFSAELYKNIDLIIPVPLHPKRQKKRGYNQSDWIAMGISDQMNIPIDTKSLYRAVATETQTRKTKLERWENVESIFKVRNEEAVKNKHILLIDDVLTTGSTIEACAVTLLKVENVKVSVATIAITKQ
ncbi:MAG: ComF family protein [Bacteroidales bacterium]|nr:ComF family protein [Bacteroidales bacterium]